MSPKSLSLIDLINLPEEQSQIVRYLIEHGTESADTLAKQFSLSPSELSSLLDELIVAGYLSYKLEGLVYADMGKRLFRGLSDGLWIAVFVGGRSYSKQEISIFRTVIPMLQFARA
jgi:DNA-binding Lrp family transcriptional regulator